MHTAAGLLDSREAIRIHPTYVPHTAVLAIVHDGLFALRWQQHWFRGMPGPAIRLSSAQSFFRLRKPSARSSPS
jgi:hypothetical protein